MSKNLDYKNQIKYMSQLEERNKIAQEIHDKIGHTIAGSLMQLEAAKVLLQRDKTEAEHILQNSIDTLRVGMDNIRVTLRNVKPPIEQLGINKIKLILDEFMLSSNIIGVLYVKGDLEIITNLQWKVLQENILEALTNIIKHSKATKVSVNIEVLNKYIKCEVKDNGIGANKLIKGIGIIGFEERTEGAGGKVIIDGSAGFSVIFLLPVKI
ncbi:sensor histidine kinase [Candidatus Clostridium radicumherbarum]|uniref:histidine kinase n=1 Tax=Candidatus Clostridium radicumherbarum TaxID=3381662 RepID=A0ABW8TRL2_9CLOT